MRYHYYTADVFTDRIFGGNQLAVFPDGRGLDSTQMQQIAREFNFSETVFVLPPKAAKHTRAVRIFTPTSELPFAGHPTVGTAFVLASIGEIPLEPQDPTRIVFEEGVGPVPIVIYARDAKPVFVQFSTAKLPEATPASTPISEIAECLQLRPDDLDTVKYQPEFVSCGVPFLFIAARSLAAVQRARVHSTMYEKVFGTTGANLYIFTFETEDPQSSVHARMFAPAEGIQEDPATGSAAAALAGYLGSRENVLTGTLKWTIEQGSEMGRPSILKVEADKKDGKIEAVRVGGTSVLVCEGHLEI
jgi:trans-2,3-dihydro-3-hydroxyanthranilate isomerase